MAICEVHLELEIPLGEGADMSQRIVLIVSSIKSPKRH